MNDSYLPFPDESAISDDGWQHYCEEAKAEIRSDLESIIRRMETGCTTKADAMLIAGYVGCGYLYETRTNGTVSVRVPPDMEDAE
jgi:hypothetical protein